MSGNLNVGQVKFRLNNETLLIKGLQPLPARSKIDGEHFKSDGDVVQPEDIEHDVTDFG